MTLGRASLLLLVMGVSRTAFAQLPAPEPAREAARGPAESGHTAVGAAPVAAEHERPGAPSAPSAPADAGGPAAQVVVPPPPAPEPPPPTTPTPESAPAPEKTPESAQAPQSDASPTTSIGPAKEIAPASAPAPLPPPWLRAHQALTLEGRLGVSVRPESSAGFDDETHVGAEFGLSLYLDLMRQLAVGLEVDRASLGRGTAQRGLDSVSIDYSVSSAMLGARVYPKRSELLDLFVGLQVGVGVQGVSASGVASNGAVRPASAYSCSASDAPAFQIGGGVGARLMITPRWGLSARVNAAARRLSGEFIEDCAQGIGSATTVSGTLGLGYDFDLDP